jgi:hypothetical protein
MFKLKIFILINILTIKVYAFETGIDHPFHIPKYKESRFLFAGGSGHREVEYESRIGMVDNQAYKFNEFELDYMYTPIRRLSIGFELSYDVDREYEVKFGPGSTRNGSAPVQSYSKGFLDPEMVIIYEFNSGKENWNQQISLNANPFDLKEKQTRNYRGGHDILLDYRFSYDYGRDNFYGKLFSHYFGKKGFYQPGDDEKSYSEAHTEVGLNLGYLYRFSEKFSLFSDGTFGLSSDYNVRTPLFERSADKGYLVFLNLGFSYRVSSKMLAFSRMRRGSRIYNATNEEINQDINYEIEDDSLFFGLIYKWGGKL